MSEYDFWRELSIGFQAIHDFAVPVWVEWIPGTPNHPFVWGLRGSEHCQTRFAELAKIGGGRMRKSAPDKLAAWLDLLHRDCPGVSRPHTPESLPGGKIIVKPGGRIDNVCAVSSRYCLVLQRTASTDTFQRIEQQNEALMIGQSVTESQSTDLEAVQSGFPKRAAWLDERLRERIWDKNVPRRFGGPDRKTIQKILDGRFVQQPVLGKLIVALNKKKIKGKTIEILEIPND
jgi:hypothetical protein